MITIPTLSDVTDILDTDLVMVTNAQGQSYKIAGSELNKRGKVIIASNTTVTGAPLKTGNCVRIYFTADITAANETTTMQINYNNINYYVKVPKDGALVNFVANAVGNTYKYVQAYITLELLYDGTQFVIMGNPIVISSADYTIYADGLKVLPENKVDSVIYDTSITDCNNAYQNGKTVIYAISPTTQNVPEDSQAWYIISQCNPQPFSSNKYVTQIATSAGYINGNEMYIRHAYGNNMIWTPWARLVKNTELSGANIASSVFTVTANWIANHTTDIRKLGIFLICNIFVQVTTAQTLSSASKIAELSIKPQNNIRVLGAVESTGAVIKAEINPQGEVTVAPYTGSVNISGYIRFESIIFPAAS